MEINPQQQFDSIPLEYENTQVGVYFRDSTESSQVLNFF